MMNMMRSIVASRWLAMAVVTGALAGCGGGASSQSASSVSSTGSSPPVTSQSPPPAPAPTPTVGAAELSWTAPDQNTDGSTLTNLAGYRIYYGTSANTLDQVIQINTVGITAYVIDNLTTGTYYFSIRAYNSVGMESALSNVVSDTIS
jgi:hypothetical protein